jgi:acetyl esterase/lipase
MGWRATDGVRLLLAVVALGYGLLAVFRAPTYWTWEMAVLATEWGYGIAALALVLVLPRARRTAAGRLAAGIAVLAAAMLLSPLARAVPVAHELPARMREAFGDAQARSLPGAPARPQPLAPLDMLRGVRSPGVRVRTFVYADRADGPLRMDVYSPPGRGPAPAVIVIHGGSWRGGDRKQLPPLNRYLAARGYVVAAIEYRLAPKHRAPDALADVLTALRFLEANAPALGVDPRRIVLMGRSAGGQLALLAAYRAHDPAVRGAISFYAPTDLVYGYAHPANPAVLDSRVILRAFLGGTPDDDLPGYVAASPLAFVGPDTPPTLLVHGGRDELVWVVHSEMLDSALAAAGRPHLLLRLPWSTHACDFAFSQPCGQLSTWAVEHFLAAVTR